MLPTVTQIDNLFRAGCLIAGVGFTLFLIFRLCELMGDRAARLEEMEQQNRRQP
jgi:hypothetical protein